MDFSALMLGTKHSSLLLLAAEVARALRWRWWLLVLGHDFVPSQTMLWSASLCVASCCWNSHAEVIARRSLVRWLYQQAEQAIGASGLPLEMPAGLQMLLRGVQASVLEFVPTNSSGGDIRHQLAGLQSSPEGRALIATLAVKSHCRGDSGWCHGHDGSGHMSRDTMNDCVSSNSSLPHISGPTCDNLAAQGRATQDSKECGGGHGAAAASRSAIAHVHHQGGIA